MSNSESAYQNELKSITKNAGITAAGLFLFNLMSFVNNAIITRWLGAEQYGLYVLATRILEFLFVIAALGLNQSIIRFVSLYQGINNRPLIKGTVIYSLKFSLVASFVLVVVVFFLSDIISIHIFNRPELSFYLRFLLVTIPFAVVISILSNTFVGLKMIRQQSFVNNILSPTLFFVLILGAYLSGFGLDGLITAHIFNIIIVAAIVVVMITNYYFKPEKLIKPQTETKKLWNFNIPVYLTHFSSTTFRLSPIFILGLYLTNTEIGIYNVSYKISALVVFSMAMFRMIFMPTISGLFAKNDKATIQRLFQTVTRWIFAFSLMVSLLIQANGLAILGIFGDEFSAGMTVLTIMLLGELINSSTGLTGAVIMMSGRSKLALANSVIQFVLMLLLAFILIPLYGTVGAAIAYAATMLIINIIMLLELRHYEKLNPFNSGFLKPIIAGSAAYLSVLLLGNMLTLQPLFGLLIFSCLFVLVFGVAIFFLKPDEDDKVLFEIIAGRLKLRSGA